MSSSTQITMTDGQFEQLAKIIYDRSGIHFPPEKKYVLESRLGARLIEIEIDNFDHYVALLSMGPFQVDEFQKMFNRITINETSFFRNEPQLDIFERRILADMLEKRAGSRRLRIWSAACSTGDEPFTIAILLHRTLGVRLSDWRIEILGTDISESALNVAAGGVYPDYNLRATPELVKARYFRHEGRQWRLDDTIRSMVSFEKHNLKDRLGAMRHGVWDVIFCRNVLIYFDGEMRSQVFELFEQQLADDGYLFIGHSETVRGYDGGFESINNPEAFCYRKKL